MRIESLWLEATAKTEAPRAMVAADADAAELSPRGDALYFVSHGSAFVQPLVRIPKAAYVAMRDAARRAVVISNAKQLGLGLMQFAQENDEVLPAAGEPLQQLLARFLPGDGLFEGFVYAFPGGKLADVREPAGTLLGYIPGPGGRANLFVDGHVVWVADPSGIR